MIHIGKLSILCAKEKGRELQILKINVLKPIYSIAQCSMITNTVLFLKHILNDCPAFWQFSTRKVRISEGTFCHVDVHIRLLNDWAT